MTMIRYITSLPIILCCAILIGACEVSPTQFDEPLSTAVPLKKLEVDYAAQFVAINGAPAFAFEAAQDKLLEELPYTLQGTLEHNDERSILRDLALTIEFPEEGPDTVLYSRYFLPIQAINLTLDSVEIPNGDPSSGSHHPSSCPTATARMTLRLYDKISQSTIEQEFDASFELGLRVEEEYGEMVVKGYIHLFTSLPTGTTIPEFWFFDVVSEIELQ